MPILSIVDATTAAILGGVGGLLVGAVAMLALRLSERSQHLVTPAAPQPNLPAGVADVLAVLRSSGIVVDSADAVVKASPSAVALGLVRETELVHAELRHLARQVRRDGVIRESELELARGPLGRGRLTMGVRVAPLGGSHVLLLLDDRTQARRVEEIRRDFVANVSHELKTPVGGLALLAEAVEGAADDPEAVERFAQRMRVEATRLTRLVQEIVDLSRLQVADTLHEPVIVDVAEVAAESVERSRLVADAKGIEIATALDEDVHVFGDRELLITAVSNLIGNAIAYSGNDTKVAVAVHAADHGIVEIAVTDQGQGIPEHEQQRIFERFYRVDPARSRATGGTGLGLAIVKHVCANHGGEVTVWSEEGRGSTFTMRLPAAPESATDTHGSPNTEAAPAAPVTREVTR
ncbi:MAG TPA: ATP-binding protein [Oryzihumus sp.]|nr:ATP-binding protein [Oryzihumus sp.]